MNSEAPKIPLSFSEHSPAEMLQRSSDYYQLMNKRRTVRDFSPRPVPQQVIANCIKTAGTAPSGANQQPWTFVAVSDPRVKNKIRVLAEEEERKFYHERNNDEWKAALAHLSTDENKPHLEEAACLIVIFSQRSHVNEAGEKVKHYYPVESTGLAAGLLISAIHHAGLVSLTHTPSPMSFLNKELGRPKEEKPFLILAVGYPAEGAEIPDISRKDLNEIYFPL